MEEQILRELNMQLQESALFHLERAESLLRLVRPSWEELVPALLEGRTAQLRFREEEEVRTLCAWADAGQQELERTLWIMSEQEAQDWRVRGYRCLCLVPGRLLGPKGVSAPAAVLPVGLNHGGQRWQLSSQGEGLRLNLPLLRRLDPQRNPEGWSRGFETLWEQLRSAVADRPDWNFVPGLWLARLPLWMLDLPEQPDVPLAAVSPRPELDPGDTAGEESILTPLMLDGRQMTALRRLKAGGSLLVRGTRGTGKTQLVSALMANAMGERQRVLYVSAALSDRVSLLERMRWLGLRYLCMDLSPDGDRTASLLRQFNRCAQLRPSTTSEDYFPLASAALQQGQSLNDSAKLMHQQGLFGMTLLELICAYLENREAEGHLPIPETAPVPISRETLQARLDCADALCDTAEKLGNPIRHPLGTVRGTVYDPQAAEELPVAVRRLEDGLVELEGAMEQWLHRTQLKPPSTRGEWARLQQAGCQLLLWQEFPRQWRNSSKIPLLAEALVELKQRTELVENLFDQIDAAWGEQVLSIDASALEKQWQYYQSDWHLPTRPEEEKLLRRRLAEAEGLLSELEQVGQRWSKAVNADPPTTRESWERSYEIAAELARWKEIPREWGDCESLDALLWDVGELIDVGRHAKESKQVLLRDWDPAFLNMDGGKLLSEWNQESTSWGLGWLKRQSELREQLAPLCRLKLNADVIESGIRWLADYQKELAQCDEIYHRWERELGEVYRKEDTVWIWLETAQRVAGESRNWLQELTGSGDFLKQYGSSEAAVSAAVALQNHWEQMRDVLGRLDVMIQRVSSPDSPNWLEQRRADCRRLRNLMNIRSNLEELARDPIPMGQIGQVLEALAIYQREEKNLDSLYSRWEPELKGLYQGVDTDWEPLLLQARQAVESDEKITRLTGDLDLRANLADDEEAMAAAGTLKGAFQRVTDAEGEIERALDASLSSETGDWTLELRENTDLLLAHRAELPLWMRWNQVREQGEQLGLRAFCACFDQPGWEARNLRQLFRKSIYRVALAQELGRMKQPFSSRKFNETLKQFISTQRQFTQRTREELFHLGVSYAARALRDTGNQEEIALLRQANRTGGVDTCAEELVRSLPQLCAQCFPCTVASPWDALRCFGDGNGPVFDYVILERSEQCPAWLGRLLLSLGDTGLLLSPGNRRMETDPIGTLGSIWSQCEGAKWPLLELDTCYLLRQESLSWADEQGLHTRSLPTAQPDRFLMACKTVVGRLEQSANLPEADALVAEALRLLAAGRRDLGIVAMTWPQKRLIRALLDQSADERPELARALKALEVVTPEEIISGRYELVLLSLTLAGDRRDSLSAAVRLAGQWEGWYTLSDALSAARSGIWVFSSLDREDWGQFASVNSPLTEFLHYLDREQPVWREYPASNIIQRELCRALNQAGYAAEPGPGPISVQVALRNQPQRPVLGILLDDSSYSSIPRAEEREVSRTQLLQERGWQLCRVWAMDWWRSQREVLDGLCQLLEHLPVRRPSQPAPAPQPEDEAEKIPLYEPASPPVIGIRPGELASPSFRNRITRIVDEILQQEAPISERQLTTRLLELFELDADEAELRAVCARLWDMLGLRVTQEGELRFVWLPAQDPDRWRSFRRSGPGVHHRDPEDVSAQESANAACCVLERDSTQTPLALARETAAALGYDPADDDALDCGRRGVDHALFMGRLMETTIGSLMPGVRK